jgi:putative GTP pyrophosphokinase
MAEDIALLKSEYEQKKGLYEQLCRELKVQLVEILRQENITLAFPIETRVKSWESIHDKCTRNDITPISLREIADIAGLRIVLLFKPDLEKVCNILTENFAVLKVEDTQNRLSVDQFGYGSVHFELEPKEDWFSLPTLKALKGLQCEVQVRTASQHIWAASSHTLQYKRESDIPVPIRRGINRLAALLEMVDLEFERILFDRQQYVADLEKISVDEPLNSDIIKKILEDEFPPQNLDKSGEDYSELLEDLSAFNVTTAKSLRSILRKNRIKVMEAEANALKKIQTKGEKSGFTFSRDRISRGVFYTLVGLARTALEEEFGQAFRKHMKLRTSHPLEEIN